MMFKTAAAATALVGGLVLVPTAASATFLPGTAPEDHWTCAATFVRFATSGECSSPHQRSLASRTESAGGALVTSRGVTVGYTGTSDGGVATATASEVRVSGVGINLHAYGVRATQAGHCGTEAYRDTFTGSIHIDKLVVNGRTYTDISGAREIAVGSGKVVIGAVVDDYYDNSFDTAEGQSHTAISIRTSTTRLTVGRADVHVEGFCYV